MSFNTNFTPKGLHIYMNEDYQKYANENDENPCKK